MSLNQQNIISHLKKRSAYSHPVKRIRILETHISWILLTGSFVYKIKKEVKFGNILDFSKLSLRKKFCKKEVILNRPLCGDMYQRTVKIMQKNGGLLDLLNWRKKVSH